MLDNVKDKKPNNLSENLSIYYLDLKYGQINKTFFGKMKLSLMTNEINLLMGNKKSIINNLNMNELLEIWNNNYSYVGFLYTSGKNFIIKLSKCIIDKDELIFDIEMNSDIVIPSNFDIGYLYIYNNNIIELTTNVFDSIIKQNNNIPILVYLWASWCTACKKLSPIINDIAQNYNNIIFCKVNVDKNQYIASKYKIQSIPTLLIFKNGKVIAQQIGNIEEYKLNNFIDSII